MELLEQCESLYTTLADLEVRLNSVGKALQEAQESKNVDAYEDLYKTEFFLIMESTGVLEDLEINIDRLKLDRDYIFHAKTLENKLRRLLQGDRDGQNSSNDSEPV